MFVEVNFLTPEFYISEEIIKARCIANRYIESSDVESEGAGCRRRNAPLFFINTFDEEGTFLSCPFHGQIFCNNVYNEQKNFILHFTHFFIFFCFNRIRRAIATNLKEKDSHRETDT